MDKENSKWSSLRDFCSAIREVVIVAAMLSLLVVPSTVRGVLERAGIRSVAGVEFDVDAVQQSRAEVDDALKQIASLQQQLAVAYEQVQRLASESRPTTPTPNVLAQSPMIAMTPAPQRSGGAPSPQPATGPTFDTVSKLLTSMKDQCDETKFSLKRSREHADRVLEQAGQTIKLTPPDELFGEKSAEPRAASIPDASRSY